MANLYSKRSVKVQKKSGFDKSFQNLYTAKVGTIVPILVDEVIPNTSVNLKAAISAALPPLASDTFMRCKLKYASFFVPTRVLLPPGVYEKWLTGDDDYSTPYTEQQGTSTGKIVMPVLQLHHNSVNSLGQKVCSPGTLADYLGVKMTEATASSSTNGWTINVSALPFLAYHQIYNDWFRNSLVQKDIFSRASNANGSYNVANSKFVTPNNLSAQGYIVSDAANSSTASWVPQGVGFCDGSLLTDLRQANFDIDLFTSATPQAQNGAAQSVKFDLVDGSGTALTESGFTISALRAANSIQQWLERNNIAGNRLVDYVKAQYGANLNDSIAQRAVLLGSGQFDVYSKGIYQQGMQTGQDSVQNPFQSVGSRYGSAYADGSDVLIKNFTAAEPGYIMVVAWLSPKVTYSTGIDPLLARYTSVSSQAQMANPILQNVGNEPIYSWQLTDSIYRVGTPSTAGGTDFFGFGGDVFGYNDRYYSWKDKTDEVHGLLRDGQSLQSFALQRTFTNIPSGGTVQISSDFLKIPTNYLDQVSAVANTISNYGYWVDTYFDYKVSMPLARYSVPSLQDPAYEHGEDVIVNTRGTQLT